MPNKMFEKSKDQNENFSGLLSVITQEHGSGRVLKLAYANLEVVSKTQEASYDHYWSLLMKTFWKKRGKFRRCSADQGGSGGLR